MVTIILATELEIAISLRPFSDQFQDLADQKTDMLGQIYCTFPNDMFLVSINGRPVCNPYFKHCSYILYKSKLTSVASYS